MKNIITNIILFSFFCCSITFAQSKSLTLDVAIRIALENNHDIHTAQLEIEKANDAVQEAFGYALPSVDLSASFSRFLKKSKIPFLDFEAMLNNATYGVLFQEGVVEYDPNKLMPMETELLSMVQRNNYEASIQITQILFNSAVFRGIGASQIYLNLSKELLNAKVANVVFQTKQAFYGVLLTKELLQIVSATYENALQNHKNVEALYKEGLVSEYDLFRVEVQAENVRPEVLRLEKALVDAKNGLKLVLGLEQNESIDVDGSLEYDKLILPNRTELIDEAMMENYDLKSLAIKRDVDEAFVDIDRSDFWPTIAAFGNYTFSGSSDDYDFQNMQSSVIGLQFSINLFEGFRTKNRVEQGLVEVKKTEEQISLTKKYITQQIVSQLEELERVKALLNAQERNVTLAQKTYDIANTKYEEGTGTLLDIKNANIELQTARTNRLQTVYDYIIANATLDKLLGRIDKTYLNVIQNNEEE